MTHQYARRAAEQYRTTQVSTANPVRLVVMLLNGAARFVQQSIEAIEAGDVEGANANIGRVQDIVVELMSSLNMDAGEVSSGLYSLYDYILQRLIEGNVKKETAPLLEVKEHLEELRETWEQLARGEGGGGP